MRVWLVLLVFSATVGCHRHAVLTPDQLAEANAICVAPDPFSDLDVHDTTQTRTDDGWRRFCEVRPQPDGGTIEIRNYDEWLTLGAILAVPAALGGALFLIWLLPPNGLIL